MTLGECEEMDWKTSKKLLQTEGEKNLISSNI